MFSFRRRFGQHLEEIAGKVGGKKGGSLRGVPPVLTPYVCLLSFKGEELFFPCTMIKIKAL